MHALSRELSASASVTRQKYARIYEGQVVELFETDGDITAMFHPDLIWVEITDVDPAPEKRLGLRQGQVQRAGALHTEP